MRGDSLRDLYAKSLALVGLGVLAGVGALVDYWPTQSPLPVVDDQRVIPELASARPVTVAALDIPLPAALRPSALPIRTAAAPVAPVPDAGSLPVASTVPAVALASAAIVPAALTAPSMPASRPASATAGFGAPVESFTAPPAAAVHAAAVPLSEPIFDDLPARFLASGQGGAEDDGGFFSGATDLAKKAGSSIVSTGSKAGASILDGLSFVGRGLKKLKIF